MQERHVTLDPAEVHTQENTELQQAMERAARAEEEVARLRFEQVQSTPPEQRTELQRAETLVEKQPPTPSTAQAIQQGEISLDPVQPKGEPSGGENELRRDSMMAHLLDSLDAGKDIGHYGRLVFTMVARHFLSHEEVLSWLTRDPDFTTSQATAMLHQVDAHDYTPPRRDRILQWQAEQEFPILPHPEDPNCGNLYRNLKFPDEIYQHIEHYQEQKTGAA
jgi:hypothetical protein